MLFQQSTILTWPSLSILSSEADTRWGFSLTNVLSETALSWGSFGNHSQLSHSTSWSSASQTANAIEDTIQGTDGTDFIIGTDLNEAIYYEGGSDIVFAAGGDDFIVSSTNPATSNTDGFDMLYGAAGNDTILATGGAAYVEGGEGNDIMAGGAGNQIMYGGAGNDYLLAGADMAGGFHADVDMLYGGAGDDLFLSVAGNNTMSGGPGADTFIFISLPPEDHKATIMDFDVSGDQIGLGLSRVSDNAEQYEFFMENAEEGGLGVVYTHPESGATLTILGVSLDDITVDNFTDGMILPPASMHSLYDM